MSDLTAEILDRSLYSMISALERLNTLCMSLSHGDPFYLRVDVIVCEWKVELKSKLCKTAPISPVPGEMTIHYGNEADK